jgi:hypothetical protein
VKTWFIEWARKPSNVLNTISFMAIFTVGYFVSWWVFVPMFAFLIISMILWSL